MPSESITKLNETNYNTWSLVMKALLICKDLWNIIDGSEPHPTSNTNLKAIQAYEKKVQKAHVKIILNFEPDQHPHVREGGPSKIWESLRKVHTAHRFALWLSMHWHLLTMTKSNSQMMQQWNATVKHIAYCLHQASIPPDTKAHELLKKWIKAQEKEDIILILTSSLGYTYGELIVTLDATPPDQLTLDYVIAHLLSKELHQTSPDHIPVPGIQVDQQAFSAEVQNNKHTPNFTCQNSNGWGPYKSNCPSPPMDAAGVTVSDSAEEELDGDSWAF